MYHEAEKIIKRSFVVFATTTFCISKGMLFTNEPFKEAALCSMHPHKITGQCTHHLQSTSVTILVPGRLLHEQRMVPSVLDPTLSILSTFDAPFCL
jgi:hypothetical protein